MNSLTDSDLSIHNLLVFGTLYFNIVTLYFITGTPIDITVYDIEGISVTAEHTEPVIVKTTVAYKGILFSIVIDQR